MAFKIHQKCMSQRLYVCILACLLLTVCNTMRFALALTLTVIARAKGKKVTQECGVTAGSTAAKKEMIFDWDETVQGQLLGAFFYGYVITQFPAGIISDMFGPRRVVFWSSLTTSIATLVTGPLTYLFDWPAMFVLRFFVGLFQGAFYASLHAVVAVWVPKQERGFLGTIVFVGAHMGNFCSVTVTGFLLGVLGPNRWEYLFYIYGAIGLILCLLFYFTTYDNHQLCPEGLLSEKEKTIMDDYYASMGKKQRVKFSDLPWKMIATNMPVYALVVGLFGHCWGIFLMINTIPKAMAAILGFDVKANGLYLGGAYVFMIFVAFGSGWLVDYIDRKKLMSITWNRVVMTTIASVGPSLGLLGVTYCECDGICAFACLIVGMGCMGTFYPSLKVNGIDLSSTFGGTVGAMSHWLGTIAGAMIPAIVAVIAPDQTIYQYRIVMWLSFIILSVTNIFYILFGSGNTQTFNFYKKAA